MCDPQENRKRSKGQTLVEYALILVLVAVVCITALTQFGISRDNLFITVSNAMEGVGGP